MSMLTRGCPEKVCIDGVFYTVNTDFKVWIQFAELLDDAQMPLSEKAQKILLLCYPDKLPPTFSQGFDGLLWFYSCGRETKKGQKKETLKIQKPIFSFTEDASLIYAAFQKEYGIDLCTAQLHWWQFWSLFSALGEDTRFVKVMGYRSVELSQIGDRNQKKFYRQMKALYSLPDRRTGAQKEQDFEKQLSLLFEEG